MITLRVFFSAIVGRVVPSKVWCEGRRDRISKNNHLCSRVDIYIGEFFGFRKGAGSLVRKLAHALKILNLKICKTSHILLCFEYPYIHQAV